MKKYWLIVFIFLFGVPTVFSANLKGKIVSSIGVIIRSGPSSNYTEISNGLADGREVTIVETVNSTDANDRCSSKKWYKIVYNDSPTGYGYACSSFVVLIDDDQEVVVDPSFETTLKQFPSTYHESLAILHNRYPNAVFVPLHATLQNGTYTTFQHAVSSEMTEGKNLLWDSGSTRDGWKLLSSYNYDTNWFKNNYGGEGKNWYAVGEQTLSYFLDPRNFLNETDIFMFESLQYFPSYHNKSGVENIFKGSFMADSFVDKGDSIKFSDAVMDAATNSSISPYFIASRIIQEVGYTRSDLVLGLYPPTNSAADIEKYSRFKEFSGYYNFYNIGASGNDIIYNGLSKAKSLGWNSEYKAIVDGAKHIGSQYMSLGQDTLYLQKWDVNCKGWRNCFSNQYMQNVEAPLSEGKKTYSAYLKDLGEQMYAKAFVFAIPIYENMPDMTSLPSTASPINYLSSLVVDGKSIANFHGLTDSYNLTVPSNTTNIFIEAKAKNGNAKISGTGNIAITSNNQIVTVKVTAANGSVKDYKINVTRLESEEKPPTLDEIVAKIDNYFKDGYMTGLVSYDDVIDVINKVDHGTTVLVSDSNNKPINSGNIGTGYKIIISLNGSSKEYVAVIYGDTNGDKQIDILDLLRVQKSILNSINLSSSQVKAADVNRSGAVDILDLLIVRKHILGSTTIKQ